MSEKIHRIVLTGGPCGGKTTALSFITDRLRSLGHNVFVVPEAATMFILGGTQLNIDNNYRKMQTQGALTKAIIALEDSFIEIAEATSNHTGKPSVILFDRGTMDAKAFIPDYMWEAIRAENGWSVVGLRDRRYDAVIHLASAATTMKEAYTLDNNAARTETPDQAAAVDLKIRNAWIGHHHLRVIENQPDFADKINNVIAAVCSVIGIPEPIENERKFLVKSYEIPKDLKHEVVNIEQTYLKSIGNQIARVRKRGQHEVYTYTHTVKQFLSEGKNIEIERMISSREYLTLLNQYDPEREPIKKDRVCFLWENQYFELDLFKNRDLIVLEAEIEDFQPAVALPPWIEIEREVTAERDFSNASLARKNVKNN